MEKQLSYQSSGWLQKVSVMVTSQRKVMWYIFHIYMFSIYYSTKMSTGWIIGTIIKHILQSSCLLSSGHMV